MKDKNYFGNVHPFWQRIYALLCILTDKNFILITGIEEFQKLDNNGNIVKGRKIRTIRRTYYGGESDFLSCLAGAKQCDPTDEYSTEINKISDINKNE